MAYEWTVKRGQKEHGPLSSQQLRKLANSGKLKPADLVRRDETGKWKEASDVAGLFSQPIDADKASRHSPAAAPTASPATRNSLGRLDLYKTKQLPEQLALAQATRWLFHRCFRAPASCIRTVRTGNAAVKAAAGAIVLALLLTAIRNARDVANRADSTGFSATGPPTGFQTSASANSQGHQVGQWGLVGLNGDTIVPCSLDKLWDISNGYAIFKEGAKYGLIDKSGEILVQPTFDDARNVPVENGRFSPWFEKFSTLEDEFFKSSGLLQAYDQQRDVSLVRGLASFEWNLVSGAGDVIARLPKHYKFIDRRFDTEGRIRFLPDAKAPGYGMIDTSGRVVVSSRYVQLSVFSNGLAAAELLPNLQRFNPGSTTLFKTGYINKSEQWIIEPRWRNATAFSEGLAGVEDPDTEKWGFIDTAGNLAIDYRFDRVDSYIGGERGAFVEGRAGVCVDDKWGYIDKTGRYIVRPMFREIEPFAGGVARVKM